MEGNIVDYSGLYREARRELRAAREHIEALSRQVDDCKSKATSAYESVTQAKLATEESQKRSRELEVFAVDELTARADEEERLRFIERMAVEIFIHIVGKNNSYSASAEEAFKAAREFWDYGVIWGDGQTNRGGE